MSTSGPAHPEISSPAVIELEPHTRAFPHLAEAEGDWLCAWCHTRIANERDRFSIDGKDEFSFRNPEGLQFEIITFSETERCQQAGTPTLQYTWFPGHAWSYCTCGECGQHLGWFYTGKTDFVALIKARLVRGVQVRN